MSARQRVLKLAFAGLSASGAGRWFASKARGRGAIFMLHHVRPWRGGAYAPNRGLEVTPAFLDLALRRIKAAGFALVTMDEACRRLETGDDQPFAVITLDDGYRDNRDHAVAVLRAHDCPYLIYCATDFLDGRGLLWWAVVEEAIRRLTHVTVGTGRDAVDLPSRTPGEKTRAYRTLYRGLRAGPEAALLAETQRLADLAAVDTDELCRALCLSWAELSTLAADPLLTIGVHTCSHPQLAKLDAGQARAEIADSRARLEARLGRPVRHLAYPVGDHAAAGPREFAIAADLGFASAVTTRPGHVFSEHQAHRTALPRVSLNGFHQEAAAVDLLASGVPFVLANRLRRVDAA